MLPLTVEFNGTLVVAPPQIVWGDADPEGIGLTVTIAVIELPEHPFAAGVMV